MSLVSVTLLINTLQIEVGTPVSAQIEVSGAVGIRGPQGESGQEFTVQAGATLSGHRAVKILNGLAYYCDATDPLDIGKAIGITTGASVMGDDINVHFHGLLAESSWNWIAGPVYVGSNGLLTQDPNGLAFAQQIGVAVSEKSLNVNCQLAILQLI